jgi:DNA ligase-1
MKEFYSGERILPKKPVYYKTDEQPELWFTAEQVWEIRGAGKCETPPINFWVWKLLCLPTFSPPF